MRGQCILYMPNSELLCVYLFIIFGDAYKTGRFTDFNKICGRNGSYSVVNGLMCGQNLDFNAFSIFNYYLHTSAA